jgi:hypothetical protein
MSLRAKFCGKPNCVQSNNAHTDMTLMATFSRLWIVFVLTMLGMSETSGSAFLGSSFFFFGISVLL